MSKGGLALSFAIVDIVSVLIHPELMAGDVVLVGSDLAVSGGEGALGGGVRAGEGA